jgi:membrane associated rhomboid family serine protease
MLPIGDAPRPRATPVMTYGLIAVNLAVFVFVTLPLQATAPDPRDPLLPTYLEVIGQHTGVAPGLLLREASAYDLFTFRHGFRPADMDALSLLVSLFLHASWLHVLGNMWFLWVFGANVEHRAGRLRYLLLYLTAGMAATLFFSLFARDSMIPLIGASGAISGVAGSYFVWFPQNRVRVLVVLFVFVDIIMLPARWVLAFIVLAENVLPFLVGSGGSVAYGAHIGGFLAGAAAAYVLGRFERGASAQPPLQGFYQTPESQMHSAWPANETDPSRFHRALDRLDYDGALASYAGMAIGDRQTLTEDDLLKLADHLSETGRYEIALAVLQRLIAMRPNSPYLARVHLRAGLIQLYGRNQLASAYQHLLTVLDLDTHGLLAQAARQGLAEIEARRSRQPDA